MKKSIKALGVCASVLSVLLLVALLPTAAFAEEADAAADVTAATEAATTDATAAERVGSMLIAGKITKLAESDGVTSVTVDDGEDGVVLHLSELRFVYDQKAKAYAGLEDLAEGLQITAVLPENAPLALSLPPQTSAVFGLLLNSDASTFKLDFFDGELLSSDGNLKLNISEETLINSDTGEKRVFTADDLKDKELLVFYDVVKESLPAQTAPTFVLILTPVADEAAPEEPATEEPAEAAYVGLRAAAEAKGYTVTWTSNSQPITLTKGDITVTVTIGSDAFTYEHLTKDVQPLDSVEKLDLVTRIEGGKTEVADTFIELLK
jgi:hypothetical protein